MPLRLLVPAVCVLLILSACASPPPADPSRALRLVTEAQLPIDREEYAVGAKLYEEAIRYDPGNGGYWLQWGDLLEASGDIDAAAGSWSQALIRLPDNSPQRQELTYRLGLAYADQLQQPLKARALRDQMPPGAERLDLDAMLAMSAGRAKDALNLLAQALPQARSQDQQGRLYYHAALIHQRLGNLDQSRASLLPAVNIASSPGLKASIRTLFVELLKQSEAK